MNQCKESENSALAGLDLVNCAADKASWIWFWVIVAILICAIATYLWRKR